MGRSASLLVALLLVPSSGLAQPSVCPAGQEPSSNAPEHCCWPEQSWHEDEHACGGAPLCLGLLVPDGDRCVLPMAIPAGLTPERAQRERAMDGIAKGKVYTVIGLVGLTAFSVAAGMVFAGLSINGQARCVDFCSAGYGLVLDGAGIMIFAVPALFGLSGPLDWVRGDKLLHRPVQPRLSLVPRIDDRKVTQSD